MGKRDAVDQPVKKSRGLKSGETPGAGRGGEMQRRSRKDLSAGKRSSRGGYQSGGNYP